MTEILEGVLAVAHAALFGLSGLVVVTTVRSFIGRELDLPHLARRRWRPALRRLAQADLVPRRAHRAVFRLAPAAACGATLLLWLALPSPLRASTTAPGGAASVSATASLALFAAALAGGAFFEFLGAWSMQAKLPLIGARRRLGLEFLGLGPLLLVLAAVGLETGGGFPVVVEGLRAQRGGVFPDWGLVRQPLAAFGFVGAALLVAGRRPFDLAAGAEGADPRAEFSGPSRVVAGLAADLRAVALAAAFVALAGGAGRWPWVADATLCGVLAEGRLGPLLAVLVVLGVAVFIRIRRAELARASRSARIGGALAAAALPLVLLAADPATAGGARLLLAVSASLAFFSKLALVVGLATLLGELSPRAGSRRARQLAFGLILPAAFVQLLVVGLGHGEGIG